MVKVQLLITVSLTIFLMSCDVGIACPKGIGIDRKVSQGTKNILHGAAMSGEEFDFSIPSWLQPRCILCGIGN